MTLARIQRESGRFSGTIAEYRKAADVRPDRVDLFTARASLEERYCASTMQRAHSQTHELNITTRSGWKRWPEFARARDAPDDAIQALRRPCWKGVHSVQFFSQWRKDWILGNARAIP